VSPLLLNPAPHALTNFLFQGQEEIARHIIDKL
jgi:hypothetical protein